MDRSLLARQATGWEQRPEWPWKRWTALQRTREPQRPRHLASRREPLAGEAEGYKQPPGPPPLGERAGSWAGGGASPLQVLQAPGSMGPVANGYRQMQCGS